MAVILIIDFIIRNMHPNMGKVVQLDIIVNVSNVKVFRYQPVQHNKAE